MEVIAVVGLTILIGLGLKKMSEDVVLGIFEIWITNRSQKSWRLKEEMALLALSTDPREREAIKKLYRQKRLLSEANVSYADVNAAIEVIKNKLSKVEDHYIEELHGLERAEEFLEECRLDFQDPARSTGGPGAEHSTESVGERSSIH